MRGLDEPVAFEVRSFGSFGPVAMHDPIEHDIDPGEIGNRFKDGRVSQRRKTPRKVDLQSRREIVVDVKGNASLVGFLIRVTY